MQSARARNSPVERAESAQFDPSVSSDVTASRTVPQLPHQCSRCSRWIDKERLALMPLGSSPWCSICHALDQVSGAVKEAQLSLAKEDEVLENLFEAFEILRGR